MMFESPLNINIANKVSFTQNEICGDDLTHAQLPQGFTNWVAIFNFLVLNSDTFVSNLFSNLFYLKFGAFMRDNYFRDIVCLETLDQELEGWDIGDRESRLKNKKIKFLPRT